MRQSYLWPSAPQESKDSCRIMEGSVCVQHLAGVRRVPPSYDHCGFRLPTIDPAKLWGWVASKGLTEGGLVHKDQGHRLGRVLPGLDPKVSELQVQFCPFYLCDLHKSLSLSELILLHCETGFLCYP